MSAHLKQAINWLALLALVSCGIDWPALFG
jgi:hypothetical protein